MYLPEYNHWMTKLLKMTVLKLMCGNIKFVHNTKLLVYIWWKTREFDTALGNMVNMSHIHSKFCCRDTCHKK